MKRIYSYVLRFDDGAAPNPFWGTCTLTICKPAIRRTARIGDWVIGTGSKNSKLKDGEIYDLSDSLVYAMKVSKKLTLEEYDQFCLSNLKEKIPSWYNKDWRRRMGDCIFDFLNRDEPNLRKSVHNQSNAERDLSGNNSLLSNEFYYFGEEPRIIPQNLKRIIKKNQGHLRIEDADLIAEFEKWISGFKKNKIYAEPQLAFEFKIEPNEELISKCSSRHKEKEEDEIEETLK
ncbi:MAG: hypothetical protein COW66_08330 [Flavobacteriaceae bacterium CG18_big_fil_WC_8_21_14_2_50_34_36]|nr:hypothetical protein [Bacteroidota bacterium]NCT17247.1 hypothetical protein [Flavobacteriia bacterium]PIQ18083.1 MAG: hypothetical protein COW66_08330 [Flavobacteriaceae bacterium CG18_big_fil_WC_8_21_14_2_50_34_36]